jgi:proteasome assembly chaperone 2
VFADDETKLANAAFLDACGAVKTAEPSAWNELRGVGIAPLVHARCVSLSSNSLGFVAFLLSCAEGDNVPDAMAMASHVLHYLEIKLPALPAPPSSLSLPPPPPFVFPPSWSHLFGRGPDASLFL